MEPRQRGPEELEVESLEGRNQQRRGEGEGEVGPVSSFAKSRCQKEVVEENSDDGAKEGTIRNRLPALVGLQLRRTPDNRIHAQWGRGANEQVEGFALTLGKGGGPEKVVVVGKVTSTSGRFSRTQLS
jgi:hypothetical protein